MVSWFSCEDWYFFSHRSNCNFSTILASVCPWFSWVQISLKLLFPIVIHPLDISRSRGHSCFICNASYLFPFFFSQSQHFFLSFEFWIIILEEDLFGVFFLRLFLNLLLGLGGIAVVTELVHVFQILKWSDLTDVILYGEVGVPFCFFVPISENLAIQILVDLLQFALA